tara:strand:+ start:2778 stop:3638 length:861 start_codon:yes stop_codon:yes gene_type:complete
MSRNKQRTNAASNPVASVPTVENPTPPKSATLSYVTPTEFVELPSGGKYYRENHPLHNKDVVEMKYMTAKDEDILASPALLRKGLAIDRLLENLIVDQNINVQDLLIGDKNALLISARISGYGNDYAVGVECPACGEGIQHEFDLSEIKINPGVSTEDDDRITTTDAGTFVVELPRTKYPVEFRLLTSGDENYLQKAADNLKKYKLPDAASTTLLKQIVIAVNGVMENSEISGFIDNMPAQDARFLRACVQIVTPNVDMSQEIECSSCGAVTEMEVPFTSEFFWPE